MKTHSRSFLLLSLSVAVSGCAGEQVLRWQPPASLDRTVPAKYASAPAVALLSEEGYELKNVSTASFFYRERRHVQLLVQSEAGFEYASVRVPFPKKAQLLRLEARTIAPDGSVREVDPKRILSNESRRLKDGEGTQFRIFRFPEVQVGSILEYAWETEVDGVVNFFSQRVSGPLPVLRYRAQIDCTPAIRYVLSTYNFPRNITTTQEATGTRMTFGLDDVPARSSESFTPPWKTFEPWWAYRTARYDFQRWKLDVSESWGTAMRNFDKLLYPGDSDLYKGFDTAVAVDDAANPMEAVQRVFDFVREHVALSGFEPTSETRKLTEVLASGYGSSAELAILTHRLLERANIHTRFVAINRRDPDTIDAGFPAPSQLDHLLLQIPDGAPGLFLDPSCQHCLLGQIPTTMLGARGLVFYLDEAPMRDDRYEANWVTVTGQPAPPDLVRRRYDAQLSDAGDLTVTLASESWGDAAVREHLTTRTSTEAELRQAAKQTATSRLAGARVDDVKLPACDRRAGVCRTEIKMTLPGYATVDGERVLVPLTLFKAGWDNRFEREKRKQEIYFDDDARTEEEVRLRLPAGFVADELPQPVHIKSAALDFELAVARIGGLVIVRRALTEHRGSYRAADYGAIRDVARKFAAVRSALFVVHRAPAHPPAAAN